ncbi:MAG: ATP-dependent DNA helicase RecG [Phycisphaeraceae bacterium]|nr:ATP-dependent DNA helicase RecG [Phycisphaeraceae bacterium]MCB9848852.1 ATP-dependent DNA helicase RecG [Phycisphaeraceae bacterium]
MPSTKHELTLLSPIEDVPGVGSRRGEAFRRLGIPSVAHLVFHLPHRHEREEAEAPITALIPGAVVTARGEVTATDMVPRGRKPRFHAVLADHTGRLDLIWFHGGYLRDKIHPGMRLLVQGKAKSHPRSAPGQGALQLINPKWEKLPETDDPPAIAETRLRPVYPASEELSSQAIEAAVAGVLGQALPLIEDHLPPHFRKERELPELAEAYRMMHAPRDTDEISAARRRLAYDELLLLQLGVHLRRAELRRTMHAPALRWTAEIDGRILARIPFALTPGQRRVIDELIGDLTKPTPANRLIQGDVGSGKTVVALYAMLLAVASHQQAALLAPTELLAEQHAQSIAALLEGSQVRIELLTGSLTPAERSAALRRIESGRADIVVGTHAVLTERTTFADLAVAVIDEQHRFGVRQRATLREKSGDESSMPHTIVMTATPIPRTLSLTIFGDLDVSTIPDLPPGRRPIVTTVLPEREAAVAYEAMRARLDKGEQGYIVVPAVDAEELRNVRTTMERLEHGALAGRKLAAVHGRLKRQTRDAIMARFRAGKIDALIATTVIEVGVDVPNATTMIVEHAERFGLAQLHQLRGRVGRGSADSACFLIGDPSTPDAQSRLEALATTTDGFALAERDFEIRGPGELFGARQSGLPPFRVADLMRDLDLLRMARRDAQAWIDKSPTLDAPTEALLKRRLLKAYGVELGLGDVA